MTHRQTGVSKGFGFVRLQSHDQALACVGGAPHIIEGRTLNVELSNLGKNAAGMPPAPAPRKRKHSVDNEGDGRGLCVQQLFDAGTGLEAYAQKVEADTHATCGAFGSIRSIGVPRPKVSGLAVWVEFDESSSSSGGRVASVADVRRADARRPRCRQWRARGAARPRPRRRPMGIWPPPRKSTLRGRPKSPVAAPRRGPRI